MENLNLQIPCTRSLTISNLYPNSNSETSNLSVGYDNNIYRSYMYFDLFNLPEKLLISEVILRLYLNRNIFNSTINSLYIYALKENFSQNTTFNNQPQYYDKRIESYIDVYSNVFLDINITTFFNDWYNGLASNDGILLKSKETVNSLLTFSSNLVSNNIFMPRLYISCSKTENKQIEIQEKTWSLEGFRNVASAIIDVERIIQGTFFIKNTGATAFKAIIEVSFDSINWFEDNSKTINSQQLETIIPNNYGKYYRVSLTSEDTINAEVKFIYQIYA